MKYLILFLFLIPLSCLADDTTLFGGFGLDIGNQTLKTENNQSDSKFTSQGYLAEGGIMFTFGGQISAEYGTTKTINDLDSENYMESGSLSYYTAKVGYNFGKFGMGVGYRHNEIKIKSLSTAGSGYLESEYAGWTQLGYLSLNVNARKQVRSTIEAQYITGQLEGITAGLPKLDFNQISISLRFFVDF